MEILHGPVHGAAVGPAVPSSLQEAGRSPDHLDLPLLRGILGRLLVFISPFSCSSRLLGGSLGCLGVGIGERQRLSDGFQRLLRQGLGLLRRLLFGLPRLRLCRDNPNGPGKTVRRGNLMGLGQIPQLSRFRAVQSRKQNPVAHALGLPAQCLHAPHGKRGRQSINGLGAVGIGHGIGHHQTVLGSCHGHIQHPHLLADSLLPDSVRNGQLFQGRIANAPVRVGHLDPQPQILMAQQLLPRIDHIEPMGQIHQKYHRKFQALGLMDAHNGHSILILGCRAGQALFRSPVQVLQETLQCAQLPLLEACGQQIELAQILLGSAPLGACPIDAFQVRLRKNQLQ